MPAGPFLAIALAAQAGAAPASPPPKPVAAPARSAEGCSPAPARIEPGEIFVCAPRPQGYRIDPDVLEAERAKRSGRPKRPERMADTACASVGPFGCTGGMGGAGIDLIGAAMVLGSMATKAVRGENVGAMFVTDPQRSEYDHYVEAKRLREAREAAAKATSAAAPPAATKADE